MYVVKDFHVQPLHRKINPMAITLRPEAGFTLLIRYRPGHEAEALPFVRQTLAELIPEEKFEVRFLDQEYAKGYLSEQKTGKLLAAFSFVRNAGLIIPRPKNSAASAGHPSLRPATFIPKSPKPSGPLFRT
jgi:hypothetical protein